MNLPRIGLDRIDRHPSRAVDPEALELVRLWQLWRPTGFAGCGPLPYSGGTAEQPVLILDAFAHCSRVAHELKAEEDRVREAARGRD